MLLRGQGDRDEWNACPILQSLTFFESFNLLLELRITLSQCGKFFLVASNPLQGVRRVTRAKIYTYRSQLFQLLAGPDQGFVPCREVLITSSALRFFQKVLWRHASKFRNAILREESTTLG